MKGSLSERAGILSCGCSAADAVSRKAVRDGRAAQISLDRLEGEADKLLKDVGALDQVQAPVLRASAPNCCVCM